ncbi:MAG TPA: efflux RND transporter periplasmic adaptor subunit [Puia sp.]|jgi:HlyD family secretion protein|nr:efflux RND transporter periplasmic adaptor subunit [Puia sp.]
MKRAIIIIVLLLLAGAAAWFFYFRKEEKPIVLQTERPRYGYISKSVTATGTVQPVDTVAVGSQVSGTIRALYASYNDKVRKGELLAELDKSLFMAQVDQFKANLEVVKAAAVYQKSTFDRQTLLYNTGAISKQDFENSQNQYLAAKAQVESVQAQLAGATKNLDYASIYSPVDGVIMTKNVSVGQTVAASFNTPTLFIIAKDITKMQVQAAVSEADIGDVKLGLRATFTVDAYPDMSFSGTVNQVRLEPVVSANVVTYSTIITAPNEDLRLKPGMTANIFIFTREIDSALLISAKDLKYKPDVSLSKQYVIFPDTVDEREVQVEAKRSGNNPLSPPRHRHDSSSRVIDSAPQTGTPAFVWIKKGDSLIEKKITTGLNNDTKVQVLSGLDPDDEVVGGIETQTAGTASGGGVRSPFMPARRGGNRPSGGSRPAGGGGGGGRGGRGS